MLDPSSDIIVLDQPTFSRRNAACFDFGAEPLVVVHRGGQQIERHLVDGVASFAARRASFASSSGGTSRFTRPA